MGTGCKPVGSAYLGSNPSAPTILARVAQSVEHFVGNEEVTGSSPVAGSSYYQLPSWFFAPLRASKTRKTKARLRERPEGRDRKIGEV